MENNKGRRTRHPMPTNPDAKVHKIPDICKVVAYFFENHATMRQCSNDIGISKNSLCWYFRELMANGRLQVVERIKDEITGYVCNVYGIASTDMEGGNP